MTLFLTIAAGKLWDLGFEMNMEYLRPVGFPDCVYLLNDTNSIHDNDGVIWKRLHVPGKGASNPLTLGTSVQQITDVLKFASSEARLGAGSFRNQFLGFQWVCAEPTNQTVAQGAFARRHPTR
jgi:hypothetical protein